jgi:hypothetical protein
MKGKGHKKENPKKKWKGKQNRDKEEKGIWDKNFEANCGLKKNLPHLRMRNLWRNNQFEVFKGGRSKQKPFLYLSGLIQKRLRRAKLNSWKRSIDPAN